MREAAIQIEQVSKSFQGRKVLKNISCELNWGQVYGIVGNNGSGKTVLMKCICGLLPYDEGSIRVAGKKIGIKNLKILAAVNHRIQETQIRETMRVVGLDPNLKQPVGKYSLGMRQRLGIAQAIMEKPEILILDEPTAGLDPKGRDDILNCLKYLREETGMTIILVSHSMDDVANYVSRIMVMNDGVLTYDDTPRNVFRHYKELEAIGLAAPQVTYLMNDLKQAGFDVNTDAITIDEAKESILSALG